MSKTEDSKPALAPVSGSPAAIAGRLQSAIASLLKSAREYAADTRPFPAMMESVEKLENSAVEYVKAIPPENDQALPQGGAKKGNDEH